MTKSTKRFLYAAWLLLICAFALLHALHLSADFPNHTPWYNDWAKYTDEGWYANAAVRDHLFANWYVPGDFNPAPAVPIWPLLAWALFCFTSVTIDAARGLAVAFFFCNLLLSFLFLRARSAPQRSRWVELLALTLLVTSPFLYCFSRLAILEPMLTALTLAALNLAVRLPQLRRPLTASLGVGLLFTLMMLTKTTAVFLLPALGWAMLFPLRHNLKQAARCALLAAASFSVTFALWMGMVIHNGLLADYKYLFFINKYNKPPEFYWPLLSFWWSFHGGLWVDHILIPLAGVLSVAAYLLRRTPGGRGLLLDPVFGASVLATAGYILFMTYQNHPQPRYFAVVAFFCFFIVAIGTEALLTQSGLRRKLAFAALALTFAAVGVNSVTTLNFALHPEYTFVDAARKLTHYIDEHPNGNRLLVSISGDQITMVTHLPSLCDDFGTQELVSKLLKYQPGWWATWNDIDPGTLEDLHNHYSLEQVASFRAFDDPERNVLVLFKLHPLVKGTVREGRGLQVPLPGDKIQIPIE